MRGKIAVIVMTALLLLYLIVIGQRAVLLYASGSTVGIIMASALFVLPVLAVALVSREILFGMRTERLYKELAAEGGTADLDFETMSSGRVVRADARKHFGAFKSEVEANDTRWQSWFRLGLVYDACGDRRRARSALREAIRLSQQHP